MEPVSFLLASCNLQIINMDCHEQCGSEHGRTLMSNGLIEVEKIRIEHAGLQIE